MAHTLFIADLHLSHETPAVTAGFLRFLQQDVIHAEALYILGDLFETWMGDDDPQPLYREIANALRTLKQHGIPCYFIHGNRDFLLGHRFADESGMILLPQELVLNLYGKRILILHGDTLCTDDKNYQRLRRTFHRHWLQKLFLVLPLRLRQRIAARLRAGSKHANRRKNAAIMDVNQPAVITAFQQHQVQWMIHGHTHRPAVHDVKGICAQRAVLGAWHYQGSIVRVDENAVTLSYFPFINDK